MGEKKILNNRQATGLLEEEEEETHKATNLSEKRKNKQTKLVDFAYIQINGYFLMMFLLSLIECAYVSMYMCDIV